MKEYTDEEKENIGHEIAGLLSLSTRGSAKGKPVYFCLHEIRNAIDVFDIVRGIGQAIEKGYAVTRLFALKFDTKKDLLPDIETDKYKTVPVLLNHNLSLLPIGVFKVEKEYATKLLDLDMGYIVKSKCLNENEEEVVDEIELLEVSIVVKDRR